MKENIKPDYQKIKEQYMSEEDIELCEKNIKYYKSAWADKSNRGIFEKMEKADTYWEGESNLPESDEDPASDTNIVLPNIEGQVANLVEQNIEIEVMADGISEIPYLDRVRLVADFIEEKNDMETKIDRHERRRLKYGVCPFHVAFNPKALKGLGLPEIKPLQPAYTFFDPNIIDIDDINEGRFAGFAVMKSVSWAKRKFGKIAHAIQPGYDPTDTEYIFGEKDGENDEISKDNYLHIFMYLKDEEDGIRLIQQSGCGVKLWDSKDNPDYYFPNDDFPIFLTPLYARDGTVWAKGDAETLIESQDLINDLDDQIRINARLCGNNQKLVNTASGIDIDKWTNAPGLNVPYNGEGDPYKPVIPPPMPNYIIDRRKYALEYESAKATRFSDQSNGIRQAGVDTATESLQLQQNANQGIAHKKLLLQKTLSKVFSYALELGMHYWESDMSFPLKDKKNEFDVFTPSKLKSIPEKVKATQSYKDKYTKEHPEEEPPEFYNLEHETTGEPLYKDAVYHLNVSVGAGLPNNPAFVYTVIKEAYRDGAITIQEYRKLLRDRVHLPVEENPPMQPIPQQTAGGSTTAMPNPSVQGLTGGGSPMLGGGM